ncbi:MAG TPA: response regulator transcription factor [Nitrospirae bacterium]|nr:response regulator transcription factor [Nitrospirota bacterium]
MENGKIVIIEDEADILEVIEYNLVREGYEVVTVMDGSEGLRRVKKEMPGLVLLDIMLPGLDGLEVCRKLKEDGATRNIPIIMVTAKEGESDIVLGLGLGADDYVTKPFSPKELTGRVRAVLRRGRLKDEPSPQERITCDGVTIDTRKHEIMIDEKPVVFTATEFRILHFLALNAGRVFTREQLLNHAVGESVVIVDRNIDVHIKSVRAKLGKRRNLIETIRGVGYRFEER